eukprot:3405634-Amphidinium_carterae.1
MDERPQCQSITTKTLCAFAVRKQRGQRQHSLRSGKKPMYHHPGITSPCASESLVWEFNSLLSYPRLKSPYQGEPRDELLLTDGSGKHPAEPTHRRCGCGMAGESTKLSFSLSSCWQSVYRAELHAIMVACEMMDGPGAAMVANKLKAGLRRPRGRYAGIESRFLASIGDKQ